MFRIYRITQNVLTSKHKYGLLFFALSLSLHRLSVQFHLHIYVYCNSNCNGIDLLWLSFCHSPFSIGNGRCCGKWIFQQIDFLSHFTHVSIRFCWFSSFLNFLCGTIAMHSLQSVWIYFSINGRMWIAMTVLNIVVNIEHRFKNQTKKENLNKTDAYRTHCITLVSMNTLFSGISFRINENMAYQNVITLKFTYKSTRPAGFSLFSYLHHPRFAFSFALFVTHSILQRAFDA